MRSTARTGSFNGQGDHQDDWTNGDWPEAPRQPRDWKKALLVLGLGALSWVATYVGMLELIQSNMGQLPLSNKIIIGFSVAMLMTMIIWLLDQMFAPLPTITKLAYVGGYLFLTLISVGFGFGFYWKVLESRSEATRSAESAVSQVKTALYAASARLGQLETTLDQLTQISAAKSIEERERGTTCPNSRPGDGPRRRLRDADSARFSFASKFVKGRAAKTTTDMKALDVDLKKIASADPTTFDPATGTRNKFLQGLTRRLELTATGFNAFRTDPQLRQIRSELAERAAKTSFPTSKGGTFSCPDPQLQSALRGVVRAIDQLPELGKPQIATVEGAQAVVEAFRRLTTTFYGVLTFKLPPSADELRALQQKAVQSVENAAKRQAEIKVGEGGLSKRDYIPLAIALFVDLCLLLVSIGRPMNRLNGLIPKMQEAERGPVYQILSRFDDIHRDQQIREKFEIFRHVVFDFNGDYYVAVPLDAPRRHRNPEEVRELQQESHLLGNLFASFEKEKIFTRVHNPLLTRKTIRKKLHRQGSKFADSEAFRTYRFRDGAWSEIILGAVMGASRGARPNQASRSEREQHALQMPETDTLSQADVRRELDESMRRAAGRDWSPEAQTQGRDQAQTEAQTEAQTQAQTQAQTRAQRQTFADADAQARSVDPTLREKYGRYANHMADEPLTIEPEIDQPAPRWPYRAPEPPPSEADVAVHVAANSNTTPSQQVPPQVATAPQTVPGNVIPMPVHRAPAASPPASTIPASSAQMSTPLAGRLESAAAAHSPAVPAIDIIAPEPVAALTTPPPIPAELPPPLPQAVVRPIVETEVTMQDVGGINVRLTERTADFTVPVTDAELPHRILQSVGQSSATQLTMELPSRPALADNTASVEMLEEPIDVATSTVEYAPIEAESELEQFETIDEIQVNEVSEDPMLRVARRFAARGSEAN